MIPRFNYFMHFKRRPAIKKRPYGPQTVEYPISILS